MISNFKFSLADVSTYRSELMGWSILWIMMLHFRFLQIAPIGFIAQYGFAGVEIFMFVSGLGLYYSLDKDDHLLPFYRKRLLRIFPTYYILGIFFSIFIYHDTIPTYLFRFTTFGYWTNGIFAEWYIPAIVFLYLLAPFFKQLFTSQRLVYAALLAFAILIASVLLVERDNLIDTRFYFLLYRIPAFLLGMACAYWIKNNASTKYYYLIALLGIPAFIWLFPQHHVVYRYKYLSLLFLMPCFIMVFCTISKLIPLLNRGIAQMGNASLEIYLIQGIIFCAIINGELVVPTQWHDLFTLLFIAVSTLLGIGAHWLFQRLRL